MRELHWFIPSALFHFLVTYTAVLPTVDLGRLRFGDDIINAIERVANVANDWDESEVEMESLRNFEYIKDTLSITLAIVAPRA
ncbi:hypothetical protein F5887DRAFT_1076333 [Amanita rubescens]|nr:hypothetical protein F5887DRAFT_1076333 [Amanita rubescens]